MGKLRRGRNDWRMPSNQEGNTGIRGTPHPCAQMTNSQPPTVGGAAYLTLKAQQVRHVESTRRGFSPFFAASANCSASVFVSRMGTIPPNAKQIGCLIAPARPFQGGCRQSISRKAFRSLEDEAARFQVHLTLPCADVAINPHPAGSHV